MKKAVLFLFPAGLALGLAGPAVAQDDAPPAMYYIVQEHVKPAMASQYEQHTKAFIKDLAATPGIEGIQWTGVSGTEVGYIYVVPIEGLSGLAQTFEGWEAASAKMGQQKWAEHMARSSAVTEYSSTSILALRNDLSYRPETAALTTAHPYRHYAWWYVLPGKEQAIEAVAREYVELYKAHGIETGWRVYQHVVGPDLPMYLVVETAESEAAFYAETARITELLGEQGRKLQEKAMQLARRIEINDAVIRPDLSFPQATQYGQRQ